MKKLATLAALAALALPVIATEVTSSNVVGYQKLTIANEFTMVGAQFVNIGGTTKDINDLFDQNTLPGLDNEGAFQTTILVWDGNGYDTYGWLDADDGTNNEVPEWDSSWLYGDMSGQAVVSIPAGKGFWLRAYGAGQVTISGEVSSGTIAPVPITTEFTMIANPLPKAINIQDVVPSATLPGLDNEGAFQTTILVWDGNGYDTYGWLDANDGTENEVPEWDSSWLFGDMSGKASDVVIGAGKAFWFRVTSGSQGTVSFK